MLKHIKPRDILEFFLFGIGILALIVLAGFLESAPLSVSIWVAVVLSVALWIVWFVLIAKERNKEAAAPKLKIMRNGQWVDVMTGDTSPRTRREARIFDQDEAAIQHLDFDNKEKQA